MTEYLVGMGSKKLAEWAIEHADLNALILLCERYGRLERPRSHKNAAKAIMAFRSELIKTFRLHPEAGATFKWPTTDVEIRESQSLAKGRVKFRDKTWLYVLGYSVNKELRLSDEARIKILDDAYKLPRNSVPCTSDEMEPGESRTPQRLERIANIVASHARARKLNNRGGMYDEAIRKYERDLMKLKKMHYDGKYDGTLDFDWPSTSTH